MSSIVLLNQMYITLILFFISFFCIIIMIGRKLVLLRNGQISGEGKLFEIPYIKETKLVIIKNIRKIEHTGLVIILRLYVRSFNFLKNKYEEIKIKTKRQKREEHINSEKREISEFLKMISDYKNKIRKIKRKIHEEEKNL